MIQRIESGKARRRAGPLQAWRSIRARRITLPCALVAGAFTLALSAFLYRHSYFYGDDFLGFFRVKTEPLLQALLVPIGSQIAPLHRLLNAAQLTLLPMNFGAALGVLLALHALGVVYLYRTLQLLKRTPVNIVLVGWYCAYPYLWGVLSWWSAGLQRIPYVALSLIAIYYYQRDSLEPKWRNLVVASLCYVLALGFYAKVLLLPLCLVGLDWVRRMNGRGSRLTRRDLGKWALCALLLGVGLLYVALSQRWFTRSFEAGLGNLDLRLQLDFQIRSFSALAHSIFGISFPYAAYRPGAIVYIACALFIAYTIYRVRRTALIWLGLMALLALNFLMIGASSRTLFGVVVAWEPRYFYEVAFLLVLFVGIILHQLASSAVHAPELYWVANFSRQPIGAALMCVALLAYATVSYQSSKQAFFARSADIVKTRQYMATVVSGLEPLRQPADKPPKFADGPIPSYVTGMDLIFRLHSQLFVLFGLNAEFVPTEQAEYRVDEQGRVTALTQ